MSPDIVIVGAGPAGLCLARALSGHGLSIVVLERQAEQALAEAAFDGREIALTQDVYKRQEQAEDRPLVHLRRAHRCQQ